MGEGGDGGVEGGRRRKGGCVYEESRGRGGGEGGLGMGG